MPEKNTREPVPISLARAFRRSISGWATSHEQELGPGNLRRGLEQQLDTLVRLEVARVENDGAVAEAELAAQRRDGFGGGWLAPVDERRVLHLEYGDARTPAASRRP